MKIKSLHLTLALTVLCWFAARPAHADITYDFSGGLTYADSGSIPVDSTYNIILNVDPSSPTMGPHLDSYQVTGGSIVFSTGYTVAIGAGTVGVGYDDPVHGGEDILTFSASGPEFHPKSIH